MKRFIALVQTGLVSPLLLTHNHAYYASSICFIQTSIPNAIEALSNAAMASFVIRNNVVASSSRSVVDVWSPWVQLNLNDDLQSADVISYT